MPLFANAQGVIEGKFTIPANVPVGTKLVDFIGEHVKGSATFVGSGKITTLAKRLTLTTHIQNGWVYIPFVYDSTFTDWSWAWSSACQAAYETAVEYDTEATLFGSEERYRTICFYMGSGARYPYNGWDKAWGPTDNWPISEGPYPGYTMSWQHRQWLAENRPGFIPPWPSSSRRINKAAVFDPLAQTFFLNHAAQISAVELWFTAKGTGRQNVLVQIREALNGVPTQTVLGQRMLTPTDITLNAWTRFSFPLINIAANQEYAFVIGAEDTVSAVATATLGEYDSDAAKWVTTQPYQVGIMLSSSNNLSWTTHQTQDITFRILAQSYPSEGNTNPSRTLALTTVNVTDADQLLVLATVERPNSQCNVVFNITAGAKTYQCVDHQVITLDARYSGPITWEAVLTGTQYTSPLLYPDIQLIAGERLSSSNYISAALDTKVSPTKLTVNMDVYVDCYLPSTTTLTATAQIGAGWDALTLIEAEALGEGWYEHHYLLEDIAETQTRLQLVMTGSAVKRPRLRNLRVALT